MKLLLRWISRWPLPLVRFLGAGLGWLAWGLSPTYRRRLALNATLAGLTPEQQRRAVSEAGRTAAEVPWLWFRDASRPLAPLVRWTGRELVAQALDHGKGLILLTPHLGFFEMAARGYAEEFGARQPITVLYKPSRNPRLAEIQTTAREAPGMSAAPASLSGVRQLLRALRKGETLGLLPDQVPPDGQGVWAPFFGRTAYTMTLAARLAQQTGATVLLCWCERLPGSAGFALHFEPMNQPLPTEPDDVAGARAVNAAMESLIRQKPEQYLWAYNRYKPPHGYSGPPPEEAA
ncbi:lysophospholipid acyltransferase family protein [Ideonella margarita]|uniref:Lysophospholipid acyltransferase family protein n=1 Tax=Ideonella margarita TaxID=2984191 RepID=A0ABU9C1D5_9BURK